MLAASWSGPDPYFDLLFQSRAEILKSLGPQGYLQFAPLATRSPAWLRDHPQEILPPSKELAEATIPSVDCMLERIAAIRRFDRRDEVHLIEAPVLVTCAEDDMITPVHLSRETAQKISASKLEVSDWGGHFYMVLRPELFQRQVKSFFS